MRTSVSIETLKRYIAKNIPFLFLLLFYEINVRMSACPQMQSDNSKTITCLYHRITCLYRRTTPCYPATMACYHLTGDYLDKALAITCKEIAG